MLRVIYLQKPRENLILIFSQYRAQIIDKNTKKQKSWVSCLKNFKGVCKQYFIDLLHLIEKSSNDWVFKQLILLFDYIQHHVLEKKEDLYKKVI